MKDANKNKLIEESVETLAQIFVSFLDEKRSSKLLKNKNKKQWNSLKKKNKD